MLSNNYKMLSKVYENIRPIKNFPKNGITFRHIGPLLENSELFKYAINQLYKSSNDNYDVVCGIDARGFIISTAIQNISGLSQVMIRKESKLPGEKYKYEYKKEYGTDILEIEKGSIKNGQKVLIVDDLMATAGSLIASIELVKQAGGCVTGVMILVDFKDMGGKKRIMDKYSDIKVHSLFSMVSTDDSEKLDLSNVDVPAHCRVNKYRPTTYPNVDKLPVLMWHPTMETFAQKMLEVSNLRPSYIDWDYFPDNWPNITFEPSDTLTNKDLIFVMSISNKEIFAEQLSVLVALPRQLINSLTIIVPYLGPATHERVDYSGQLATVEPILKILSSCIPMTKTGPPVLRIFDIHALQTRFYINDKVTMKLMSAVPVLLNYLKNKDKYVIAYPDDGSYKRFKYFFKDFPQVICCKIRDGDLRKIIIKDRINWPEDINYVPSNVLIIDDLVQSGETLLSCSKVLKELGFLKVSAYVTHSVFPNNAWKKFIDGKIIDEFITTNTNPHVTDKLKDYKNYFTILDVNSHLCSELAIDNPNIVVSNNNKKVTNIYVGTTNVDKLNAVYESITEIYKNNQRFEFYSVNAIRSEVPEQPFGLEQTHLGSKNRVTQCNKIAKLLDEMSVNETSDNETSISVAIENGIYSRVNGEGLEEYIDVPIITCMGSQLFDNIPNNNNNTENINTDDILYDIKIPEKYKKYIDESIKSQYTLTFGSIIEKNLGIHDWHKYISGITRKQIIKNNFKFIKKCLDLGHNTH